MTNEHECSAGALPPSEHAARPALRWPGDVADLIGIAEPTLKKLRADGDHPRLYAIGRALFTTVDDVRAWITSHELERGALVRPPIKRMGGSDPRRPDARSGR